MNEPAITINGRVLTPPQASIVRRAVEAFTSTVLVDPDGGSTYLEQIRELRRMMYQEAKR